MLITQKQYPGVGKQKFLYKPNRFTSKEIKLDFLKIINQERNSIDLKNQLNKKLFLSGQNSINYTPQDQTSSNIQTPKESTYKIEEHIFNQNITHRQSQSQLQVQVEVGKTKNNNSHSFKSFTTCADAYFFKQQQLSQHENSEYKKVQDSILPLFQNEPVAINIPSVNNITLTMLDQNQDNSSNRTKFLQDKKINSILKLIVSEDKTKKPEQNLSQSKRNSINIHSISKSDMNDVNFAGHLSNLNVLQSARAKKFTQNKEQDFTISKLPVLIHTQAGQSQHEQKTLQIKQNKLTQLCQILYELIVHTKAISFNDLIENFVTNNPGLQSFDVENPDFQIKEFVSVLRIVTETFKSEKLLNQILIFHMNIDESLFKLMFKKIKTNVEDHEDFYEIINDQNLSEKYKLRKNLTREEIILRVLLQSQQIPDSKIENIVYLHVTQNIKFHMSRMNLRKNPSMKLHQELIKGFSDSDAIQKKLQDINLNLDLIKKIFYFKKSLQTFMHEKQIELAQNYSNSIEKFQRYFKFDNISQVPQQYHHLFDNSDPQDQNITGQLEEIESNVGRFDKILYSERFKSEKLTRFRQVIEEVKYKN